MAREKPAQALRWRPQGGPQTVFVNSGCFEVVYGGARGGGKTDAALGDFAIHAELFGAAAKGLLVRRTRVALEPTIARAREIFRPAGAVWHEQKSAFIWKGGAVLSFRYLDRDSDADGYQGHDYSRVYVEELTQFASPRPVDKLKAALRSAAGAPCGFRATCNPGGPGHNWVKARYIDAGPPMAPIVEDFVNPFDGSMVTLDRVFIPARLSDNPALLKRDPLYVARLQQSGSAQLVRAWLEGDWNVVEGSFFDKWSGRNVVRPFTLPGFWTRFRSFDWGYAAPFSVGWWAVASDDHPHEAGVIPRGALVRYREWYGSTGKPGEGLRLDAEQVARGIAERDAGETISYGVADPSIFRMDGGPSIAERMARAGGQRWRPADNTRVGKAGALGGWDQMRARINGDGVRPSLYVFETCRDFIRTVPVLQHDPARPEDLDTGAEDHVADEARYACLSRPLTAKPAVPAVNPSDRWEREWGRRPRAVESWKTL
jgi:Terminase large subunit, T4likevirus-type, N-terminal